MIPDKEHAQGEGRRRRRQQNGDPNRTPVREQGQHGKGKDDVELLLHPQRPGVEKRVHLRRVLEVTGLQIIDDVGREQRGRRKVLGKALQLLGRQQKQGERRGDRQRREQGGKDSADAADIEVGEGEGAALRVVQNDRADEVAGNHEEHIDADVSAAEQGKLRVEQQNRKDRYRAKAVDVGAVRHGTRKVWVERRRGSAVPNPVLRREANDEGVWGCPAAREEAV
ncbi:protein of unknown function [Azospirillum baldaniorum]|uniref:Uncharacterized protein n=1 Tax=Azospirillum baldaniorum TaxID=1064539 RepID=A0A9P1JNR1_9PROT|nr:protein of unknown function [Azospirillum baldaniorum]